ncbi:hypothetical protein CDG81_17075 [Actinopolyspora erythraea]|uniref:Acyl-CoA oxidase n=1 Tax=Actinopolyspora erythraea TaxID=414996 RepID=A0A223RUY3_9ACTN|nr:acyl-CoA dehydrogenase [Actinopolyspora erythraea]ASU79698.1 hypothetical protein CDG81_17075 [Actinopolyspora erythraea]
MTRTASHNAVVRELADLLHPRPRFHEPFRTACEDPLFAWHSGLTADERCELAYRRLRMLDQHGPGATTLVREPLRLFALQEWAAVVDPTTLSLAAIHYNLCQGTIRDLRGSGEHLEQCLDELARADSFGVFLATELAYGNNVAAMETRAVYDPESREYTLHTPGPRAVKFMPNTGLGVPKTGVVLARLISLGRDRGVFPFVVPIRDGAATPGVKIRALPEKPGLDLDNAVTAFDRARIPYENLLPGTHSSLAPDGRFHSDISPHQRFARAMGRVTPGKLGLAGGHVAAARAAVALTTRYSHQRRSSGKRGRACLMDHGGHRSAVLRELARVYATTFLVHEEQRRYAEHRDDVTGREQRIALTKAYATWSAAHTVTVCRERCGAQGLFSVNRIPEYIGLGHVTVTSEGDNSVVAIKAAQQIVLGVDHTHPPVPGVGPSDSDMLDPAWWYRLIIARKERLIAEARKSRGESSTSSFETWSALEPLLLEIAHVSATALALETMLRALGRAESPTARHCLHSLAGLEALDEIARSRGWYVLEGLMGEPEARNLPKALDELRDRIAPHSRELVEAFDVPQSVLRAPIGAEDYIESWSELAESVKPRDDGQARSRDQVRTRCTEPSK